MSKKQHQRTVSAKRLREALNLLADQICAEAEKFNVSVVADRFSISFNNCTINITAQEGGAA